MNLGFFQYINEYHDKIVVSIMKEEEGIGSIEFKKEEYEKMKYVVDDFIDNLNDEYRGMYADKGGDVR